jgi:hypothetical protein
MPTQIDLVIGDSKKIVIEFIDNDFTAEFIPHLKKIHSAYEFISHRDTIPEYRSHWYPVMVESHRQYIINAVTELNSMGLNFPIPVENIVFDGDNTDTRKLLNRLHRCFTTGNSTRDIWEYGTDHTFYVEDEDLFNEIVHRINVGVHNIECYTTNDRVKTFPKYTEYLITFMNQRSKDPKLQPKYFNKIKDEHLRYFTAQLDYDVWLPLTQIEGKDYCQCYLDYDDPTQWDISTNVIYSGSLALGDRKSVKDPALEAWLRSYGIEPGPRQCGMPLGHIVEGREYINTMPQKNAIQDIVIR